MAGKVLTQNLSEPLKSVKSAQVNIDCGPGHLAIDRLADSEYQLARGSLQYLEKQGIPGQSMDYAGNHAALTLKAGDVKLSGFRFPPWAPCGGAYQWQIQLNSAVALEINAQSRGGNAKLNLTGMNVTRLWAESGGGNLDIVLPDNSANLVSSTRTGGGNVTVEVGRGIKGMNAITAESGAGNVVVRLPGGIATRVHCRTGMGKVSVDPRFTMIDKDMYQSADYDTADSKIEVTARSGAGNVNINTM